MNLVSASRKWTGAPRIAALLFCFLFSASIHAQAAVSEYQLKAAFLFKFPTYVEWPPGLFADDAQPLTFGVIGSENMRASLETIVAGQTLNGRTIRVVSLLPGDPLTGIQVLFVGDSPGMEMLLDTAVAQSVLTVTEVPDAHPVNSMVNFVVNDNRVRFDIALPPADAANLKLSVRLLQVARSIDRGDP